MCHPEVPAGQPMPNVTREEVAVALPGGEQMPALLARPEGGSGPGVLVVNDVFGRSPFYENLAARLATAGFVALDPEYFFRVGSADPANRDAAMARRGRLDEKQTAQDLLGAVDWLKRQPGVRGDRMGTVGFCMGGTLVLNLAAEREDLTTVCFYGFPAGVPQKPNGPVPPLDQVDRVHGPILAFWGDRDTAVGLDNVQRYADEMRRRNLDFEYTIYPGLGHGFLSASRLDPDHEAYDRACAAWTRTVDFYRHRLGVPVPA